MNKEINLLVPEQHDTTLLRRIAVVRAVSLSLLFLIVLFTVSVFVLILASPLPQLREQESQASLALRQLGVKSGKLFLIRERLRDAGAILTSRPKTDTVIDSFMAQLPPNATVESLKINGKTVTVTISSASLFSLNTFTQNLLSLKNRQKNINSLSLSGITYDAAHPGYFLTVNAAL